MGVHENCKGAVADKFSSFIMFIGSFPGQQHSQRARKLLIPLLVTHFPSIGLQPDNVFNSRALDAPALEEAPAPENRVIPSQRDQSPYERKQFVIHFAWVPI